MKEYPMNFNDAMVRAILSGQKTQTRRIIKPQPSVDALGNFCWGRVNFGQDMNGPCIQSIASPIPSSITKRVHCPFGTTGDRLWVRECWQGPIMTGDEFENEYRDNLVKFQCPEYCSYRADGDAPPEFVDADDKLRRCWRPSIHMKRWACRLVLEIVSVRVERLQDMSEQDAKAEGLAESWDSNPWVWAIEFKIVEGA